MKEKNLSKLLIVPVLLVILALAIFPMILTLVLSFCSWNLRTPTIGINFIGLGNYSTLLFGDTRFIGSLINTFSIAGIALTLEFLIGLGAALLLSKKIRGKTYLVILLIIPMFVSPMMVGAITKLLFIERWGIFSYSLDFLAGGTILTLSDPILAKLSLVFADVWQWTPLVFLILFSGIQTVPRTLYESGNIEGASDWQQFRYVTLHFLKPFIFLVILFRLVDLLKFIDPIWITTYGGPGTATETYAFYNYMLSFVHFRVGYAAAAAWLILPICLSSYLILAKLIFRGRRL